MNLWKIEPFDLPSTDRTAQPKQIVAIEIAYGNGKVAVLEEGYSSLTLAIDYYDSTGEKRSYLQDRVDSGIIASKAIAMGLEGDAVQQFVQNCMDVIVKDLIGGATKVERCAALTELALMFGQVVLPVEEQTGII